MSQENLNQELQDVLSHVKKVIGEPTVLRAKNSWMTWNGTEETASLLLFTNGALDRETLRIVKSKNNGSVRYLVEMSFPMASVYGTMVTSEQ